LQIKDSTRLETRIQFRIQATRTQTLNIVYLFSRNRLLHSIDARLDIFRQIYLIFQLLTP